MSKSVLSVFIDESGDFGPFSPLAPYYIVSMVLHEQRLDISRDIASLKSYLKSLGFNNHLIHTMPLVRKESPYRYDDLKTRRFLFRALFEFTRRIPVKYLCVKASKKECPTEAFLVKRLLKDIGAALQKHSDYFRAFRKIIIYYDNGQSTLTGVLKKSFLSLLVPLEFRLAKPYDYELLQVADLVCTMELISEKCSSGSLSRSELAFFGSARSFRKDYFKHLRAKRV